LIVILPIAADPVYDMPPCEFILNAAFDSIEVPEKVKKVPIPGTALARVAERLSTLEIAVVCKDGTGGFRDSAVSPMPKADTFKVMPLAEVTLFVYDANLFLTL